MTSACASFTLGNDSRQPSTSPSATRLPSTLTRSSSRPSRNRRPVLSSWPRSPVRNQPPSFSPLGAFLGGLSCLSACGPTAPADTAGLLTQMTPFSSCGTALPCASVSRTSTPPTTLPTDSGDCARRSTATTPASVVWYTLIR